jgi:hypothetical protein
VDQQDPDFVGHHGKPKPMGWAMPIAAALFGLALFIPGYFLQHSADVNARTYSASAVGTVQDGAHEVRGHKDTMSCKFSYQFTPDGADSDDVYAGTGADSSACGKDQAQGAERTVYYDPGNPRENTTQNPNGISNRYVGMVVLELPGGLLILWAVIRSVLNIVRRRAAARS